MTRSFAFSLALVLAAATAAAGQSLAWPEPPAEAAIRFERVVRKLADFEVAIQGPTETSKRINKLKRPSGVAFDARGRLLVSDSRQSALLMVDADLGVVLVYGTGTTPSLREPMGVAVADDGTIFVADAGLRGAVAFNPQGEVEAVYGDSEMQEPTDVALSPDGSRLYVTDARAHSVAIFDVASRDRVETMGARGSGVAEFQAPHAVEFDSEGRLLIVDQLNSRVQVFDAQGAFTRALQSGGEVTLDRPSDVAVDDAGRIYVTDAVRSEVAVFDEGMDAMLSFGRNGLRNGEFLGIGSVAAAGNKLAVLDRAGGRIQLFELAGIEPVSSTALIRAPAPTPIPAETVMTTPLPEAVAEEPAAELPIESTILTGESDLAEVLPQAERVEATDMEPMPEPETQADSQALDDALAAVDAANSEAELIEGIEAWAAAWAARDADAYLGFYATSFVPEEGRTREDWAELRRERIASPGSIDVALESIEIESIDPSGADVTFVQSYASDSFSDRVLKRVQFVFEQGEWKIGRETVLEVLASP